MAVNPKAKRTPVQEIESDLEALRAKVVRLRSVRDDPFAEAGEVFADELRVLLGDDAPAPGAVRRAARLAVAEQAWEQRVGRLLDTRDVVELLAVSKQRVSTLVREHRLIALPQGGRPQFPAWQFALPRAEDREALAAAHRELVEAGGLSPWSAASWFEGEHAELDGCDPVGFLRAGGERERLAAVASRDAERLGQ